MLNLELMNAIPRTKRVNPFPSKRPLKKFENKIHKQTKIPDQRASHQLFRNFDWVPSDRGFTAYFCLGNFIPQFKILSGKGFKRRLKQAQAKS